MHVAQERVAAGLAQCVIWLYSSNCNTDSVKDLDVSTSGSKIHGQDYHHNLMFTSNVNNKTYVDDML